MASIIDISGEAKNFDCAFWISPVHHAPRIVSESCYVIFGASIIVASTGRDDVGLSAFLGDKVYTIDSRCTN